MGLSSAVEWWEEWQLRILVLASLFIQYILFFSPWVRLIPVMRKFRVLVWIAYISSDAVAIFALATLFNRHRQTCDAKGSDLEVLWAPVLVIHLGGQPFISAYSIEDNELWKRHVITLVSQVTVALYVFFRWGFGQKTLLPAAATLFILGILRYAQKPWALRTSSFNNFEASNTIPPPRLQREEEPLLCTLEQYVQAAKKCVLDAVVPYDEYDPELNVNTYNYISIDRYAPYIVRIEELTSFMALEHKHAYNKLEYRLGDIFGRLYTRSRSIEGGCGCFSILILPILGTCSLLFFIMSRKDGQNQKDVSRTDGQNEKDVMVTYILLCCTALLEYLPACVMFWSLYKCCKISQHIPDWRWHGMVSQHNIMSLCVRKKIPTLLMKLATFNFLRELVNQYWYVEHVLKAYQITTWTVRPHIEDGWKKYIRDAASYRRFSEFRGQWALRRYHQLHWSLNIPFDESVLVWHVATDLCFYHPSTSPQCRQGEATQRGRVISNYMLYLFLIRPEMLMPGTRWDLFILLSDQISRNSNGWLNMTEETLAREILSIPVLPVVDDMISNARKLADALMELGGEDERWTVIQGVWVEMLCYSASRCRGYLHAKSLGEGGEYLSYVWLLWSFMGMDTLAERHQMSEPPQEEEDEEEEEEESHSQGIVGQSVELSSPV